MKTLAKILLPLSLAIIAAGHMSAQDKNDKRPSREQFAQAQAQKIADDLLLDEATAKQFTTTFTQCQKEIWDCAPKNCRPKRDKKSNYSAMTEDEAREIIQSRFAHRQQIENIQQKYYTEYSKFLTQRQILRVYDLEKKMLDRMFRHRMDRGKANKGNKHQPRQPRPSQD